MMQLPTQAKSFKDNPLLGSSTANRLGLHVSRLSAAHAITAGRRRVLAALTQTEHRQSLSEQGYLVIQNYLPNEQFKSLLEEVEQWSGTARECHQGDTITRRLFLDQKVRMQLTQVSEVVDNRDFQGLLRWSAGRNRSPLFHLERVVRISKGVAPDPQRYLHSDTFHPTIKCWLYLDDVDDQNGTFRYVPGSHRLSKQRLRWEYAQSQQGAQLADRYARKGSLRIQEDELADLSLATPIDFAVPKNTLLIADTHGFHARGNSQVGASRRAIFGYARSNPFDPWPGIGANWISRWERFLMSENLKRLDRRAEQLGNRASWFQVPGSDFTSLG